MAKDIIASPRFLGGLRVLEIANELGEYCGKVLAGLGADVVKVEAPGGEETRSYGPFYEDQPDPDRSLYFWHYNAGKRGIVLDFDDEANQRTFRSLAEHCDLVIDTREAGYMDARGLGFDDLKRRSPGLLYARISPFGDEGPWKDFQASDLVHLALGGVMMNCGYDPDPFGNYDTPPVAPQMWQAYHIAGEMTVMSILAALYYRARSGRGQLISTSVHQAVSANTETDLPDWVMLRQLHRRLTSRHSMVSATGPALASTKDGRFLLPYRTYLAARGRMSNTWAPTLRLLKKYGKQVDLDDPKYEDEDYRWEPAVAMHIGDVIDGLIESFKFDRDLWREAQDNGLPWAPVRRPEENIADDHWAHRQTFAEVEQPEFGRTFTDTGARWVSSAGWNCGRRAPLIGEHTEQVKTEWIGQPSPHAVAPYPSNRGYADAVAPRITTPLALAGVRVVDLSWLLASAGAGRFLAAFGAEVIKVEHETRWDTMRFGLGLVPPGGRQERDTATGALPTPAQTTPNQSGSFMEINAGKLGISLNLKDPDARRILEQLIKDADVVLEGFSPGTMDRMGFGYDRLRELNPGIVYVQQSGFGQEGTYGRARAFGPSVQAISGVTELSGLPAPYPPAGIGYSYLDWWGAYNVATATLAGLCRRDLTGDGVYIDASQAEVGIYLTGTAVLDYSANGRRWSRYGNQSPYKPAAPHGAYATAGTDRWIAIAAFSEEHWTEIVATLGKPEWSHDPRFATLPQRIAHADALDDLLGKATADWDGPELMQALQAHGVPAGVCQDPRDRYENDPQLRHLEWMVELEQSEIGTWPVKAHPVKLSETPAFMGGYRMRSGPSYGEHTDLVLGRLLGLSADELARLRRQRAI